MWVVYETPAKHPYISKEERNYIEESIGEGRGLVPQKITVKMRLRRVYGGRR